MQVAHYYITLNITSHFLSQIFRFAERNLPQVGSALIQQAADRFPRSVVGPGHQWLAKWSVLRTPSTPMKAPKKHQTHARSDGVGLSRTQTIQPQGAALGAPLPLHYVSRSDPLDWPGLPEPDD
jgi:hypothetical protein